MPKRKNADTAAEGSAKRQQRALQAATHQRGGTHRVKDQHRTGTKWDYENRAALERQLKGRKHIYKKDLKKHEIARLLAEDDRRQVVERKQKEREHQKKLAEAKREKGRAEREKARLRREQELKKAEREQRRRAAGGDVAESSSAGEEQMTGPGMVGNLVDDEWDETSETEDASSIPSATSPVFPHPKLRIFEWPYLDPPSPNPPLSPWSPSGREREDYEPEVIPKKMPYAVMNLVTSNTGESLELPGRTYPDLIGPDFVPKLTQYVMHCARNGALVGTLRKAVIESGITWAERTHVQWWNGRMYLALPQRSSFIPLHDVYTRWNNQKKTKAKDPNRTRRRTPSQKEQQNARNKKQMMLDIFASSEYRPPICYAPVDLEYPHMHEEGTGTRSLENLYYIRFPGMDLPHYYFWTRPHEWEDPTIPNPEWLDAQVQDLEQEALELHEIQRVLEEDERRLHPRRRNEEDVHRPYKLDKSMIRVKKSRIGNNLQKTPRRSSKTSKFQDAVEAIEQELYHDGLAAVLHKFRGEWLEGGKEKQWKYLIDNLPELYPSGKLPDAPPVHQHQIPRSLAEKFACIEVPSASRPVSPIQGDEPWTRDDDNSWDIAIAPKPRRRVSEAGVQDELRRSIDSIDLESLDTATTRCSSRAGSSNLEELDSWLDGLTSSSAPLDWSSPLLSAEVRDFERREWEKVFENEQSRARSKTKRSTRKNSILVKDRVPSMESHFEALPVTELKWKLHLLMDGNLRKEQSCRVCLKPVLGDAAALREHYEVHHDEVDEVCPFCGLDWTSLNSKWKASHIFSHDFDDSVQRRHSSLQIPELYSLPHATRSSSRPASISTTSPQPRRPSKVHFSPKTVERRIAYNDHDDAGMDADLSSAAATSPRTRKSSLKQESPKQGGLKVDTSSRVTKRNSKRRASTAKNQRKTNGNGNRSRATTDTTYHSPTTPSDHISSPELHLVHRHPKDHPDAAWNPRRHSTSGSEHIKSPYLPLPHNVKYPHYHPEASFDPRRWSSSAYESLEYYTGRRVPRKKADASTAVKPTQRKAKVLKRGGTRKGKGNADKSDYVDVDEAFSASPGPLPALVPEVGQSRSRRVVDPIYRAVDSPTSASSYEPSPLPVRKGKAKRKVTDSIYRDEPLSSPSLSSMSAAIRKRPRKSSDPIYQDLTSPSTASEYEVPKVEAKKGKSRSKGTDLTYRDGPCSPASSSSKSPVLRKPGRSADPRYRYESLSETPSLTLKKPARRGPTKSKKTTRTKTGKLSPKWQDGPPPGVASVSHKTSTMSNASTGSDERRATALTSANLDILEPLTSTTRKSKKRKASVVSRKKTTDSKTWPALKKRKLSTIPEPSLERRASVSSGIGDIPDWDSDDYIDFSSVRGTLYEASDDELTGNPFAPPPKKSKAKTAKNPKRKATQMVTKKQTPNKKALEVSKAAAATELADRHATRATGKKTISGRPFVEPLTIAPARRLAKASPKRRPSISMSRTADEVGLATGTSTTSSKSFGPRTPKSALLAARGRRSSAPTPSPSLASAHTTPTPSTNERSKPSKTPKNPKPAPLAVDPKNLLKRPSYDVPFSDARPIVPPNTPAVHNFKAMSASDSGSELDAGMLSDKIGRVKTTRGGLVRELPDTVRMSVISKAKARGRSVAKAVGKDDDKVVSGRVEKQGATKTKTETKTKTKTVKATGTGTEGNTAKKATAKKATAKKATAKKATAKKATTKKSEIIPKTNPGATPKKEAPPKAKTAVKPKTTRKTAEPKAKATKRKVKVVGSRVRKPQPRMTRSQDVVAAGKKGKK